MKNGIGDKVLGWFIVADEEEPAKPAPQAKRPSPPPLPVRAGSASESDTERLAKVMELLASLPAEATAEVKRAIVGAALHAFGVPVDRIVESARGAIAALDTQALESQRQCEQELAQARAKIEALTAQIAETQKLIERQRATQTDLGSAIAREKGRVRAVLEFFEG